MGGGTMVVRGEALRGRACGSHGEALGVATGVSEGGA